MKDIKTYILENKENNIVVNAFLAFDEDPNINQENDKNIKLFFNLMEDKGYYCEFNNHQDGNDQTLDIYKGSVLIDSIAFIYATNNDTIDELQLWFETGNDKKIMNILGAKKYNQKIWTIKCK